MKTPEEIKKGLECCMDYQSCTEYGEPKCPYNDVTKCMEALLTDAIAYIRQLESRLAQVERERDAAVKDLKAIARVTFSACLACEHSPGEGRNCPRGGDTLVCFKWRGICPENTKGDADA